MLSASVHNFGLERIDDCSKSSLPLVQLAETDLPLDWRVKHRTLAAIAFKWLRFSPKLRQLIIYIGAYSSLDQAHGITLPDADVEGGEAHVVTHVDYRTTGWYVTERLSTASRLRFASTVVGWVVTPVLMETY